MARERLTRLFSSRRMHALFGIGVTLALLVWALRGVSPSVVFTAVRGARPDWLVVSLVALLASVSVRARRWGTLLGAHCDPGRFTARQSAVFIGFAGNCILPLSAGELIRAAVLHRTERVPFGTALGSILTERLLDAIVVFLMVLAPLLSGAVTQSHSSHLEALHAGWIGGALLLISAAFFVAARWPRPIAGLAGYFTRRIGLRKFEPRVMASLNSLMGGLEALRCPKRCITAIGDTLCIWGLIGVMYWSSMQAFGISSPGILGALFVGGVASLATAIPSVPGYFGVFEAAVRFALEAYAVPANTIVAYALVLHFLMYSSLTAIGVILAGRLGLSWAELVSRTQVPLPMKSFPLKP